MRGGGGKGGGGKGGGGGARGFQAPIKLKPGQKKPPPGKKKQKVGFRSPSKKGVQKSPPEEKYIRNKMEVRAPSERTFRGKDFPWVNVILKCLM